MANNFTNLKRAGGSLIRDRLADRCAVIVGDRNGEYDRFYFGPCDGHTLFDLASVSKIAGAGMVALRLIDGGQLSPDTTLGEYLPETRNTDKETVTVGRLMSHTSGMTERIVGSLAADDILGSIINTPLAYEPGSRVCYSCPGFITLGILLERVCGEGLDRLARRYVFEPLGMERTLYNPRGGDIAPGLKERPYEVSDFRAYAMGGVAGNAGIFSCADDMSRFGRALAQRADALMSRETFDMAVTSRTEGIGSYHENTPAESRGLAFNLVNAEYIQTAGLFAGGSWGHTGWTGTSVFADRDSGLYAVILSNRHALGADDRTVRTYRQLLHLAIQTDLGL